MIIILNQQFYLKMYKYFKILTVDCYNGKNGLIFKTFQIQFNYLF